MCQRNELQALLFPQHPQNDRVCVVQGYVTDAAALPACAMLSHQTYTALHDCRLSGPALSAHALFSAVCIALHACIAFIGMMTDALAC